MALCFVIIFGVIVDGAEEVDDLALFAVLDVGLEGGVDQGGGGGVVAEGEGFGEELGVKGGGDLHGVGWGELGWLG